MTATTTTTQALTMVDTIKLRNRVAPKWPQTDTSASGKYPVFVGEKRLAMMVTGADGFSKKLPVELVEKALEKFIDDTAQFRANFKNNFAIIGESIRTVKFRNLRYREGAEAGIEMILAIDSEHLNKDEYATILTDMTAYEFYLTGSVEMEDGEVTAVWFNALYQADVKGGKSYILVTV